MTQVSCRISQIYAEFGNTRIVQNIELWLPVKQ